MSIKATVTCLLVVFFVFSSSCETRGSSVKSSSSLSPSEIPSASLPRRHSPPPFVSAAAAASARSSESAVKVLTHWERVLRNLPSLWSGWTRGSGNKAISRQVFDMIDIVTDVAMLTVIGIPILGLVAVGATALSPLIRSTGGGRKRRDAHHPTQHLLEQASQAVRYTSNLYDLVTELQEVFETRGIDSHDCQLRAICEVHRSVLPLVSLSPLTHLPFLPLQSVGRNSEFADFGDKILQIMQLEKKVEEGEVIPLAKLFFKVFADAAKQGIASPSDCSLLYPNCDKDIAYLIRRQRHTTHPPSAGLQPLS